MDINSVRITDLVSDPNNARKHDEKNLEAIKGSLTQFGQRKPIVVQGNVVIAGNGTLEAARQLGWDEIEIVQVPEDWTKDQAKAFALADNRTAELAGWDEMVLAAQVIELKEAGIDVAEFGFVETTTNLS
jgi:site-specific DNA-methyltransferase (adenine-specific)